MRTLYEGLNSRNKQRMFVSSKSNLPWAEEHTGVILDSIEAVYKGNLALWE